MRFVDLDFLEERELFNSSYGIWNPLKEVYVDLY